MSTDGFKKKNMLLSPFNIGHYLLDKGYVHLNDLVSGHFSVHTGASRNHNFIINKEQKDALFVKQPVVLEGNYIESIYTEASCYWLAYNDEKYKLLADFLPKYYDYDYLSHILITAYLSNSKNLHEYYLENKLDGFISNKIAALLVSYHKKIIDAKEENHKSGKIFKRTVPMIFKIGDEDRKNWWKGGNEAEKLMLDLIDKDPDFLAAIKKVVDKWEINSLIHGDIKSANFLVDFDSTVNNGQKLLLIDWELADFGDYCWDLAAVFQMYLLFWIYSQDVSEYSKGQEKFFNFSLEEVQQPIQEFWKYYCQLMEFDPAESDKILNKTVNFCALKLIHTCFESTPNAQFLSPYSAQMLQLSINILKHPKAVIAEVFGINKSDYAYAL